MAVSDWRAKAIKRSALAVAGFAFGTAAHADWVIAAGSVSDMGGGTVTLGCTDLYVAGTLTVGAGGSLTDVRSVFIEPSGSLQLDGGRLELAQQWVNQGSLSTGGGQVLRVDSATCPAAGPVGPIGMDAVGVPTLSEAALAWLAALLGWLGLRSRRRSSSPR